MSALIFHQKKKIMVARGEDLTEIYKVMGGGEKLDCSLSPSVKKKKKKEKTQGDLQTTLVKTMFLTNKRSSFVT